MLQVPLPWWGIEQNAVLNASKLSVNLWMVSCAPREPYGREGFANKGVAMSATRIVSQIVFMEVMQTCL